MKRILISITLFLFLTSCSYRTKSTIHVYDDFHNGQEVKTICYDVWIYRGSEPVEYLSGSSGIMVCKKSELDSCLGIIKTSNARYEAIGDSIIKQINL